ncbi:unnamed protein product, partial [Nesidiocoris tenuis]
MGGALFSLSDRINKNNKSAPSTKKTSDIQARGSHDFRSDSQNKSPSVRGAKTELSPSETIPATIKYPTTKCIVLSRSRPPGCPPAATIADRSLARAQLEDISISTADKRSRILRYLPTFLIFQDINQARGLTTWRTNDEKIITISCSAVL